MAGVPVVIPALSGGKGRSGSFLCPVRALRIYLRRTRNFRKGRERLFISYVKSYEKEICPSTISRSAGAQLSRDILFHFWQKYFFFINHLIFFINCKFNISGIKV